MLENLKKIKIKTNTCIWKSKNTFEIKKTMEIVKTILNTILKTILKYENGNRSVKRDLKSLLFGIVVTVFYICFVLLYGDVKCI